jgi:hypothetical protein
VERKWQIFSSASGLNVGDDLYYLVTSIYAYLEPSMVAPPFGPTDPDVVELLRIVGEFEEKMAAANPS